MKLTEDQAAAFMQISVLTMVANVVANMDACENKSRILAELMEWVARLREPIEEILP